MLYWIFDLDHTLYHLPDNTEFNYNKLKKDSQLNKLLNFLPCDKIIFTNGTYFHAKICLDTIDILNNFSTILARDNINSMKPDYNAYLKVLKAKNIKKKDKCVFFEDSIDNLVMAKTLGWITVLISKKSVNINKKNYIDFCFPNIYLALNYFSSAINNHFSL